MSAFWLSLAVFAFTLAGLVRLHFGLRQVRTLAEMDDTLPRVPPAVSIIVSALDEAATIEPALRSLLALDYPRLEIIAIDDRSTDGTGAILDALARQDSRLRVLHVTELPPGWLGKNHALHQGALAASGDYLLFTDADVHFAPSALRRAVAWCESQRLDHLVVLAEVLAEGQLLRALLLDFCAFLVAFHPPWKVRSSRDTYIGMGAFNMVRAPSYRAAGGHAPLRLEVVDDLMLGKRMKMHGFRQDALLGHGAVMLEWYRDAAELVRGLEKNGFAKFDYSIARVIAASVLGVLARGWPILALFVTRGATWWLNAGTIAAGVLVHAELLRLAPWNPRVLWCWPIAAPVMLYTIWRSTFLTCARAACAGGARCTRCKSCGAGRVPEQGGFRPSGPRLRLTSPSVAKNNGVPACRFPCSPVEPCSPPRSPRCWRAAPARLRPQSRPRTRRSSRASSTSW